MEAMILTAWTIREWLALFTLAFIFIFPAIAMRRMFIKGADEKNVDNNGE